MSVIASAVLPSVSRAPATGVPTNVTHQEFARADVENALTALGELPDAADEDIRALATVLHHMSYYGLSRLDNEQLDARALTLLRSARGAQ